MARGTKEFLASLPGGGNTATLEALQKQLQSGQQANAANPNQTQQQLSQNVPGMQALLQQRLGNLQQGPGGNRKRTLDNVQKDLPGSIKSLGKMLKKMPMAQRQQLTQRLGGILGGAGSQRQGLANLQGMNPEQQRNALSQMYSAMQGPMGMGGQQQLQQMVNNMGQGMPQAPIANQTQQQPMGAATGQGGIGNL